MKTRFKVYKMFNLAMLLFGVMACSQQATENTEPIGVTVLPIFVMKLHIPENEDKKFIAAFLEYAKTNHLGSQGISNFPRAAEKLDGFDYQIKNSIAESSPRNIAFSIANPFSRGEVQLAAYPDDTPFVKSHIYNLVHALMSAVHGKVTEVSCDEKVLDCARLKDILK
jgi:hypothetical protein